MRPASARVLAFGIAVAAAACVEIATGPSGVTSVRLQPVPSAIIAGDSLRDSTGAVVPLRGVAFDARGDSVADAPFRFVALALAADTTAASRRVAIAVDSVTGAVTAFGPPPLNPRARIAMRLGDRLQVTDTIAIVKKPTRLTRAAQNGDSAPRFAFLCSERDTARVSTSVSTLLLPGNDTARVTNAIPIAVLLTADSIATARAAVPSYFVRFDIVSPSGIPEVQLTRGGRRPAISIIRDLGTDRGTNTDTTDAQGVATAYLRVVPAGLPPTGAFAADTFTVRVRASARTSPTAVVPAPVEFDVRLRRLTRTPNVERLTGPGCP